MMFNIIDFKSHKTMSSGIISVEIFIKENRVNYKVKTNSFEMLAYLLAHPETDMGVFKNDLLEVVGNIEGYKEDNYIEGSFSDSSLMRIINAYFQTLIPKTREMLKPFAEKYGLKLEEIYE